LISLGCLIGLNVASKRGNMGPALVLLLAFGIADRRERRDDGQLLRGDRSDRRPPGVGATALFVGALGAGGYAVRRDLSFLYRIAFFLLLGFLGAGIVLIFVRIDAAYTIWALAGLGVFGLYTVIDFNRLRHAGRDEAIPLAAGIFLDVLNVFLLFLQLFARR
jgi:hypothetical protein